MAEKRVKQERFSFSEMKAAAMSPDVAVRKRAFTEYYERFQEFPSYLFETETHVDEQLLSTVKALVDDPSTSKEVRKGIEALLHRLPSNT